MFSFSACTSYTRRIQCIITELTSTLFFLNSICSNVLMESLRKDHLGHWSLHCKSYPPSPSVHLLPSSPPGNFILHSGHWCEASTDVLPSSQVEIITSPVTRSHMSFHFLCLIKPNQLSARDHTLRHVFHSLCSESIHDFLVFFVPDVFVLTEDMDAAKKKLNCYFDSWQYFSWLCTFWCAAIQLYTDSNLCLMLLWHYFSNCLCLLWTV